MGQRHQLFVIAKINNRYRCLAAIHHQWLYGHTALRRCLGTLEIFQAVANRLPLQQELIAAAQLDDEFWTTETEPADSYHADVRFPFTMTCLVLGASFSSSDGYHHSVMVEPFTMKYNQGDNNNGVTIFDITDLGHTRYCFVDFYGMESEGEVQLMAPLPARVYLEAYYNLEDEKHVGLLPVVEQFKAWDLVSTAALEDTWPGEGWEELEIGHEISPNDAGLELEKLDITSSESSLTLRERAMTTLIQSMLTNPSLTSLSDADLLSDFPPKLRSKLYENAQNLMPSPELIDLLVKALATDFLVDLSPFKNLSTTDIFTIILKLQDYGKMTGLNLSNRPDLAVDDVKKILSLANGLQSLYLFGNPQIPLDVLATLQCGCEIYHPELFQQSFDTAWDEETYSYKPSATFDFSHNNHPVVQLVWILIGTSQATNDSLRKPDGSFVWDTLSPGGSESYGFGSGMDGLKYISLPLLDTPLSSGRVVTGLSHLLQWSGKPDNKMGSNDVHKAIASSFAMGYSNGSHGIGQSVGPLSPSAYLYGDHALSLHSPKVKAAFQLKPGQWSIVFIQECFDAFDQEHVDKERKWSEEEKKFVSPSVRALKRVRYALVSPSQCSQGKFDVTDIPSFVEKTMGVGAETPAKQGLGELVNRWKENFECREHIGYYGESDIHEILQKLFPATASEGDVDVKAKEPNQEVE